MLFFRGYHIHGRLISSVAAASPWYRLNDLPPRRILRPWWLQLHLQVLFFSSMLYLHHPVPAAGTASAVVTSPSDRSRKRVHLSGILHREFCPIIGLKPKPSLYEEGSFPHRPVTLSPALHHPRHVLAKGIQRPLPLDVVRIAIPCASIPGMFFISFSCPCGKATYEHRGHSVSRPLPTISSVHCRGRAYSASIRKASPP